MLHRFNPVIILLVATAPALLLAGEKSAGSAADRLQQRGNDWSIVTWSSLAGALVIVAIALWIVSRLRKSGSRKVTDDPRQLLHELCKAHGLSRRAERLIRRAAAALAIPHPGRLILEPAFLKTAAERPELGGQKRALLLLHERLFGIREEE